MSASNVISHRKVYAFHGGIHPEEHKQISNQTEIKCAPLPPRLIVPVQQHIGQPGDIIVEPGQLVLKGELIAQPQGLISVGVHAPTSGTIIEISDQPVPHASGMSDRCIVIEPDGKDQWCQLDPHEDYTELSISEIQQRVRNAGVAGMGGAGFPTEVKLHPPRHDKVATLILNAAECEPYITADDRLLRERADQVVKGMEIMAYVLEPGECLIGIEDNKPEAIAALQKAVEGTRIEVVVVPTKYPSGGEKQLIKLLTDKEVPSGKIPADVGVVCQNVGTAAAVYRAVRFGEPLISRITTLTGEQVAKPGNVEVLIGTPINWLLNEFGYQSTKPERVIMGGPMMGFALSDLNMPVVKTTNCLLAPSLSELPVQDFAQACIRCGLCAEACPAELLPQQLYWFARGKEYEKAEHHNLFDCIECGACSYVCPSAIPLVQYYRHAKGEIRQQKQDQAKSDQARIRFEARQERLDREAAEKEAKRKARAEAAAKAQAAKQAQANDAPTPQSAGADPADSKQAAIQAALARKQVKPEGNQVPDLDTLKETWDKAQAKLDKMLDTLEQAKQDNPEQVEKLTRAVEKNQVRVTQAKQAYETAKQAQAAAQETATEAAPVMPDLDALQALVTKAQAKLVKMEEALEQAKEDNPEQVEKLQRAVDKNKVRVEQAQTNFAEAQKAQQASYLQAEQAESVDISVLENNLSKAQAKLEKMIESLEQAQQDQPELVEKLGRAVDKNKVRVKAAQDALDQARSMAEAQ